MTGSLAQTEDWLLRSGYRDIDHPGTAHAHSAEWLLAGHNCFGAQWYDGAIDGIFGPHAAAAAKKAKWDIGYLDISVAATFGPGLRSYLTGARPQEVWMKNNAKLRAAQFVWPTKPKGIVIGWPGQGTHSFRFPPNNWESDNAWDIAVPLGSQIVAVADGVIGKQFGPLPDPDPRFHGIRLHLVMDGNEAYYAHMNATAGGIRPGAKVKQGQLLGASGSGNGVAHLHIGVRNLFSLIKVAV